MELEENGALNGGSLTNTYFYVEVGITSLNYRSLKRIDTKKKHKNIKI